MLDKAEMGRWERLTDAMLLHAANDDPEAFAQVVQVLERAKAKLPMVAAELRGAHDYSLKDRKGHYSWADLARALGIRRQSAMERFAVHKVIGCPFLYHSDRIRKDGSCPACGATQDVTA